MERNQYCGGERRGGGRYMADNQSFLTGNTQTRVLPLEEHLDFVY